MPDFTISGPRNAFTVLLPGGSADANTARQAAIQAAANRADVATKATQVEAARAQVATNQGLVAADRATVLIKTDEAVEARDDAATSAALAVTAAANASAAVANAAPQFATEADLLAYTPADGSLAVLYVANGSRQAGVYRRTAGAWPATRESATLPAIESRLNGITISTVPDLPFPFVIEDALGAVVLLINPDGTIRWNASTGPTTGLHTGTAQLTRLGLGGAALVTEETPGFAALWEDANGIVSGGIRSNGSLYFTRAEIGTLEADTLIVPGLSTGENYPGLVDAIVDRYGFATRIVRTDGVSQQRANPVTQNRADPPNFAPNAVAILAPAGDRLEGWWQLTNDLTQAVTNLSVWGSDATIVGTPGGSTTSLTLGPSAYLTLPLRETGTMTVLFVAALAGDTRGVLLSSRIVDLLANDRATPWGLELALEPTTGGAGNLVATVSHANMTTEAIEDLVLPLAVTDATARRLYLLTIDPTSVRLDDLTAGTSATATLPGEHYAGRQTLRLGADRGGVTSGNAVVSVAGIYRAAITAEERAALSTFVKAYGPYLLGVTL